MGAPCGRDLAKAGHRVLTSTAGRSARSTQRAEDAGMEPVTDAVIASDADIFLSILPPRDAIALAARFVAAHAALDAPRDEPLVYADCNAISPETTRMIERIITAAGMRYVDASIVGGPPNPETGYKPRFYCSGAHAEVLESLGETLDVRVLSDEVGDASGLKMCYGAVTKGISAIATQALVSSRALGVEDALRAEFASSLPDWYPVFERAVGRVPLKAHRWIGEMEEISSTFGSVGMDPLLFKGVANTYRFLASKGGDLLDPDLAPERRALSEALRTLASALEE